MGAILWRFKSSPGHSSLTPTASRHTDIHVRVPGRAPSVAPCAEGVDSRRYALQRGTVLLKLAVHRAEGGCRPGEGPVSVSLLLTRPRRSCKTPMPAADGIESGCGDKRRLNMRSSAVKCGQVRSSAVKRNLISVLFLLGVCLFWITASGCGKDKKDDSTLLFTLLLLNGVANPTFVGSCASSATLCVNYFGMVQGSCTPVLTTRCSATNAIGACRTGSSEGVYYTGYTPCTNVATCQSFCQAGGGMFNSSYTGL